MTTIQQAGSGVWLTGARLTNAQWLAVSVFEDVIDLPGRIATTPSGLFGTGSPARYHVPMAPLILGSAIGALTSARTSDIRRPLLMSATCTIAAAGLTGFLIRTVNIPLMEGSVGPHQHARLIARWHRVNKARVALLALGGLALEVAAQR